MHRDVGGPRMAHCGFALVEVLVCALMLGLGAAGLAWGLRASWTAESAAARAGEAVAHIGDLAESLRAVGPAGRQAVVAAWQERGTVDHTRSFRARPSDAAIGPASWRVDILWFEQEAAQPANVVQAIGLAP